MLTDKFFAMEVVDDLLILAPLQNIGSLSDKSFQPELKEVFSLLEQHSLKYIVVDFSQIDYFGSSMIETLLRLWRQVHEEEGTVAVCGLSEVGKEILSIGKFDTLWPVYATRDQAIEAIRGNV